MNGLWRKGKKGRGGENGTKEARGEEEEDMKKTQYIFQNQFMSSQLIIIILRIVWICISKWIDNTHTGSNGNNTNTIANDFQIQSGEEDFFTD